MVVTISEQEHRRLLIAAGELEPVDCKAGKHDMQFIGGANAGCGLFCSCSVSVFQCSLCGECDYGENEESQEIRRRCQEKRDPTLEERLEFERNNQ